jgi:hypothetical protein
MRLHDKTHRHFELSKPGVGTFKICESLLPGPLGRATVEFQPDPLPESTLPAHLHEDRWYGVPNVAYTGERDTLFIRMLHADDGGHAMRLLRQAYEEDKHD